MIPAFSWRKSQPTKTFSVCQALLPCAPSVSGLTDISGNMDSRDKTNWRWRLPGLCKSLQDPAWNLSESCNDRARQVVINKFRLSWPVTSWMMWPSIASHACPLFTQEQQHQLLSSSGCPFAVALAGSIATLLMGPPASVVSYCLSHFTSILFFKKD